MKATSSPSVRSIVLFLLMGIVLFVQLLFALQPLQYLPPLAAIGELPSTLSPALECDDGSCSNSSVLPLVKVPEIPVEESFAACALVMDENHRLTEWIAYHYFAMPLRTLIIAIDPKSKTSPTKILDRWRPYINIIQWENADYLPKNFDRQLPRQFTRYIYSQQLFIRECSKKLKTMNHTWVIHQDVDEYWTVDKDIVGNNSEHVDLHEPGHIVKFLQDLDHNESLFPELTQREKVKVGYSPFARQRSVFTNVTCSQAPRNVYAAIESNVSDVVAGVPTDVISDPMQFETLRFRFTDNAAQDRLGKSILRVDRIPDQLLNQNIGHYNPHTPIHEPKFCNKAEIQGLFQINHYVGSWETYSFRSNDSRGRNHTVWAKKALHDPPHGRVRTPTDHIRGWVQAFVDWQGKEAARYLLQNVGMAAYQSDESEKRD